MTIAVNQILARESNLSESVLLPLKFDQIGKQKIACFELSDTLAHHHWCLWFFILSFLTSIQVSLSNCILCFEIVVFTISNVFAKYCLLSIYRMFHSNMAICLPTWCLLLQECLTWQFWLNLKKMNSSIALYLHGNVTPEAGLYVETWVRCNSLLSNWNCWYMRPLSYMVPCNNIHLSPFWCNARRKILNSSLHLTVPNLNILFIVKKAMSKLNNIWNSKLDLIDAFSLSSIKSNIICTQLKLCWRQNIIR